MPRPTPSPTSAAALFLGSALLVLAAAPPLWAGANHFTPVGGPEGGAVRILAAGSGGRVWAATEVSGLFHSTDGAASWEQVVGTVPDATGSGLDVDPSWSEGPILSIAVDPVHPDTFFASSPSNLFRTRDGGATWTPVGLGGQTPIVLIAPSDPSIVYAVGGGLTRSRNGGDTWQTVPGAQPFAITALAIDPHDPDVLYGGTRDSIWRSRDGGVHWRPLIGPGGLGDRLVLRLAVDANSPHLYAGTDDGLYSSADGGATWALATSGPTRGAGQTDALVLDPFVPNTVYVAVHRISFTLAPDDGAVFKSSDGGATWTWLYQLPKVAQALAADPATSGVLYAGTNRDGAYRSADGGTTWSLVDQGLIASFVTSLTADPLLPDTLYATAQATPTNTSTRSLGAFKSTDRGATWQAINAGLNGDPRPNVLKIVADPRTAGTLYAPTFDHGLFKSTDAGASWQAIDNGLPMDAVLDLAVDPKNPQNLYAVGFERLPSPQILKNAAARSTDGGASWTPMTGALTDQYLQAVAVDPTQPSRLYAGELLVFGSTDSGASWARFSPPNFNTVGQLVVEPVHGFVYAVTTNNGFYKSLDQGFSWLPYNVYGYSGEVGVFQMALDPVEPSTIYVTSYHGVLASTRAGGEWAPIDPAITKPMAAIAVEAKPLGTIYASQRQGGSILAYTPAPSACVTSATTVCLLGRFAAQATYDYLQAGTLFAPGSSLTAQAAGFQLATAGTDLLVKIVDGRAVNGSFWLFYNAFQSYYTVRVTDTQNGRFRFYSRWRGSPIGDSDIGAFPDPTPAATATSATTATAAIALPSQAADATVTAAAARSCVPGPTTLCLFRNRFRVEVTWKNGGVTSAAQALPLPGVNFGGFTFFGPDDLQIAVELFDHRRDYGHWWIAYSALTDLDYAITFTDTVTGHRRTYTNGFGNYTSLFDSSAF